MDLKNMNSKLRDENAFEIINYMKVVLKSFYNQILFLLYFLLKPKTLNIYCTAYVRSYIASRFLNYDNLKIN